MNILITAPSLDPKLNVSGISTMVNIIIQNNRKHHYSHYELGKTDKQRNKIIRIYTIIKQLLYFPIFIKQNQIQIVHQNLPFDPKGVIREYLINLWCRLFKVPVVLHLHGGQFISHGTVNVILKKIIYSLFYSSRQVIVLSEIEKKILDEKFNYSNANVLPNSIDLSKFDKLKNNELHDPPILLYLGRIEKNKGVFELIDALKDLKKEFSFKFILCGTGPLAQYCTIEFKKILGDDFNYLGVVTGEDKINTIKLSNIFILPSYFEGMPMALLETMAAGVIPIVTNVGSMKHIIKTGYNGFLVRPEDSGDLFMSIKALLSSPEAFPQISENASKTIFEKYDINNYMAQLNLIYETSLIMGE
jgi:glycosyltransferase involved in cell wall biosynthesis